MKKSYPINSSAIFAKLRASGLHFLCSLLIFAGAFFWMISTLYPQFHFALNGGIYGLRIIAGVDLVLGPLLTLLVFHPMKPMREKVSDFAIIGVVQIAALIYGLHTMYQEHPRMLTYYQYGTAVTITQREWSGQEDLPKDTTQFSQLGGVPIAAYQQHNNINEFVPLNETLLAMGDKTARETMSYDDDKARLAELDKQHGKLYILAVVGKYQGAYVALDAQQNMVATFGQRDLQ